MPKVSILLVNYNYGKYLDERIQSFLNQTYKDFELIIIDNASTDNSVAVINQYIADPRIKTQLYSENNSPYKRWNDGIDLAVGEYFLLASSDDSCHPRLLEALTSKLDSYPSVGLAYSQSLNIDDEGKRIGSWKEWTDDMNQERWSKDFVDDGKNECQYLLFKCTIPNAGAVLLRRQSINKAGRFDTRLRYLADWMLWAKILTTSDIAFIAEALNYSRVHENSLTNTTKSSLELEERLYIIKYLLQELLPSEATRDAVFNQTVGSWSDLILHKSLPLRTTLKIYNSLKSLDPKLNYRLTRHIIKKILKQSCVLRKLRQLQP